MATNGGSVERRIALVAALSMACAALVGCGGSSQEASDGGPTKDAPSGHDGSPSQDSPAPQDSRPKETGTPDSSDAHRDAGPEEAGPDCGSVLPSGKQLVTTKDPVAVLGLTTDGYAVYLDTNAESLSAVPLTGGSAELIGSVTSQGGTSWIRAAGVLFLPTPTNPVTEIAPLSAWTKASGANVISASAFAYDSYYYTYDVDSTAAHVAFFATTDGDTATLTLSSIDGKTQTPLATEIDLTNYSCPPIVQFTGEILVASYCTTTSAGSEIVAAFSGKSFTESTLATVAPTGGPLVSVSPAGTQVLVPASPGLTLYPLAGGASTTVDAAGASGLFAANGDIVYTTTGGALKRYRAASSTTTTLVASNMTYLLSISPDGNWAQVGEKMNSTTGLTNLYLAPAATAGTATLVWGKTTAGALGFSTDSTFSVFGTDFPMIFGAIPYDVETSPTAGGAPTEASQTLSEPLFLSGSKMIINDNITKATGAADIESIDLATPAANKTLVTQAAPDYVLTASNQLVFSWQCRQDSTSGVWLIETP